MPTVVTKLKNRLPVFLELRAIMSNMRYAAKHSAKTAVAVILVA
jgi:hypothetical protein